MQIAGEQKLLIGVNEINEERHSRPTTEFLKRIEEETGKPIRIETRDDIGAGMYAAYITSPDEIKICLSPLKHLDILCILVYFLISHVILCLTRNRHQFSAF